ncbi:MAG TPA: diguanylate cyclase [Anaerolineales bacterium]|nr:diguanylate cyclase [Anaerolineales bacterium]
MNPSWLPELLPKYENPQMQWRARILAAVLLNGIPLTLIIGAAIFFLDPGLSADLLIVVLLLAFEISVGVLWHRRGLDQAAHVLVFGAWLIVAATVLFSGGLTSTSTVTQLFIVLIAVLLTSTAITLSIVIATGGFNATVVLLDLSVGLPAAVLTDSVLIQFASHMAVLVLSAATLLYANLSSRNQVQNLANSERKFRALFEKSLDVVFLIGLNYAVIEANANASKLLGFEPDELIGKSFPDLMTSEDRPALRERFERAHAGEVLDYMQSRFLAQSGDQIVMDVNLALVRGDNGKPLHYQSTARDITARVAQDRQLQSALATMAVRANTDYLTGILNRDAVLQHAEAEWARHKREGRPLSIMLVDMDELKFINDTYGHNIGDQALRRLVEALDKNRRPYDWLGRYGGDEFMLVLPGATLTHAREIALRMAQAVANRRVSTFDGEVPIRCSIGVSSTTMVKDPPANVNDLVKAADAALYENKALNKRSVS